MNKQEKGIFLTSEKSLQDKIYLCKKMYQDGISNFITLIETINQSEEDFLEMYEYDLQDDNQEGIAKYRAIQEILNDSFDDDEKIEFKDSFFDIMRDLYSLA